MIGWTYIVDSNNLLYEFGHDRLLRHLKRVGELNAAINVLNVFSFDACATRHLEASALVGAASAAVPVLAYRVHPHARLQTLGESTGGTPLTVERGYVALTLTRVTCEHFFVLHGAFEEALARLAWESAVVEAGYVVAAYGTRAHRATVRHVAVVDQ